MLLRLRRFAKAIGRDAALLWFALRHPLTPVPVKLFTVLLALYVISPLDLVPDWLPIAGWLDDVGIVALAVGVILRFVPQTVLDEAQTVTSGRVSRWAFWKR